MIDPTVATIIGSLCTMIPPSIFALAAWRQSKVNGKKTDENTSLTAATKTVVGEVKELADGNFKRMQAELKATREDLKASQEEIKTLHETVGKLLETIGNGGKRRRNGDVKEGA